MNLCKSVESVGVFFYVPRISQIYTDFLSRHLCHQEPGADGATDGF